MQRVIDEMAKAKSDVEKRYREKIPEIIRECMAFAYLGKTFTFSINEDLEKRVNQRFIELSDEILSDIETRAKRAIRYANEEEDEDAILAYMKREQGGEDLITRIDKHNSNFRYFLEGWIAIGMVNGISQTNLLTNILSFMNNVYVSDLWQKAFKEGYLSNAIRTRGYHFGKGILRNPMEALTEVSRHSINEAFQYGRFIRYQKEGAIGYTIHRNSGFDCPYCDSFTEIVHPMTACLLPLHPRCVCYSMPVYRRDTIIIPPISKKGKGISQKDKTSAKSKNVVDYKSFRAAALDWAKKDFISEKLPNGDTASRLRLFVTSNNDELVLNKTFIEKTYSHYMTNSRDLLETAMNIVMASKEWMPNVTFKGIEEGRHHEYPFRIYEGEYMGKKFELQAKVTDGFYPYLIKIK